MDVETGADEETDQTDSVGNLLDCATCASQRGRGDPFATVLVYDETEGEV